MDNEEATARENIRTTLARYTWSGDHSDVDGMVSTFAADGTLDIKGVEAYRGRQAIREAVASGFGRAPSGGERATGEPSTVWGEAARFSHHLASTRIEFEDNGHARCWSYFAVWGPRGVDHWGRYTDRLVREGGEWLFEHRRVSVDGRASHSVTQGEAS